MYELSPNKSYSLVVRVQNSATREGKPVGDRISAVVSADGLFSTKTTTADYAANELKETRIPFTTPGTPLGGSFRAHLLDPAGGRIPLFKSDGSRLDADEISDQFIVVVPAFTPAYPFEFPVYPALPGGQVRYVAPVPGFAPVPGADITVWAIGFPASVIQWYAKLFDPGMGWSENYFQNPIGNPWRPVDQPCGFHMPRDDYWSVPDYGPGETNIVINAGPMDQQYGGQYGPVSGSPKFRVQPGDVIVFNYADGTYTVMRAP